ncbi:hypothetical protein DID77_03255 [Candidatus Marinamargulisbacteria bacterium SCGC AG-439-L15]|nr:hypothetical protein DID77_03255 [Candidatus Marinamargulisbacteria bacterium SCGC AG-439-L15]
MPRINNVLVIDDQQDIGKTLELVFPEFQFMLREDGPSGLDCLGHHPDIDVIFLDYHMPGINGLQTLKAIKKTYPEKKVIMISVFSHIIKEAMDLGADGFIEKPLNFDDIQEMLWQFMDQPGN